MGAGWEQVQISSSTMSVYMFIPVPIGRPAQTPVITERPSVGGIANSSSLLRLSTALTVILVLVAALIL